VVREVGGDASGHRVGGGRRRWATGRHDFGEWVGEIRMNGRQVEVVLSRVLKKGRKEERKKEERERERKETMKPLMKR
jgi:spore coat polysaccharide biosynthesis protein SpsF (cytidylyltransferase family)